MAEPLWNFALTRYQRAAVAEGCLRLQESTGADVNMLLAAAWLAERNYCWTSAQVCELIACCRDWREHCILPLRAVRRYLKAHPLYERAQALELDAEIQQLHALHDALQTMPLRLSSAPFAEVLADNLHTYFDNLPTRHPAIDIDLRALIAAFCA